MTKVQMGTHRYFHNPVSISHCDEKDRGRQANVELKGDLVGCSPLLQVVHISCHNCEVCEEEELDGEANEHNSGSGARGFAAALQC